MADIWQLFLLPVTTATETLVGGTIDFYEPGTTGETTRKNVYLDQAATTLAANPYPLGSNATAQLYGAGYYHVVIKSADGVVKYDIDYMTPQGTAGTIQTQRFSGDDILTEFTLASELGGPNATQIYVDGVYQQKNTYVVDGTTLTFSSPPAGGTDNIEVVSLDVLPVVDPLALSSAADSADLAQLWANEDEDVPVTTEPDLFSAKHWAAKAAAVSSAEGVEAPDASTLVKRTATGAVRAADAVEDDEALVLGQYTAEDVFAKVLTQDGPTSGLHAEKVGGLNVKIVEIGDWNMDAVGNITVPHGIADYTKIRPPLSALIRGDNGGVYDLVGGGSSGHSGGISAEVTTVRLDRVAGGAFDSTSFDSTGYNRGWITIWYTE